MLWAVYPILDLRIERKINISDLKILDVYCDFSLTLKVKCPDSLNLLPKQSA